MDRLDRAALQERVSKLFMRNANEQVWEFREYQEVLDILWDKEFMEATLRMLELAGKIPYRSARISFLQMIIEALVQPLPIFDAAGMLHMVLEDLARQKPIKLVTLPFGFKIPASDDRPRPGVY